MNAPEKLSRTPGIHAGISNAEYHAGEGISKSQLATIAVCPANFYGLHINPRRPARQETAGQRSGTLTHTLTLEPETFDDRYAVGPDVSRATKAWKEWEAALPNGVTAIKPDEHEAALKQAESLRAHSEIGELLGSGVAEATIYWTDEETGLLCRCRPDWLHETPDGWIVLDIKTGPCAQHAFASQVARLSYHGQDAFYSDGTTKATGKPVLAFVFGVVETAEPYLSACYMLDDEAKEAGRRWYRKHLNTMAECLRTNVWPGYEGIPLLSLPRWASEQADE